MCVIHRHIDHVMTWKICPSSEMINVCYCDIFDLRFMSCTLKQIESKVNVLFEKVDRQVANEQVSKTSKADKAELRESKQVLTIQAQSTLSPQLSIADQVKLAIQEQTQNVIRARSQIIRGLSESADTSDINKVLEVDHITTSLPFLPEDIESVTRLGSTSKVRTGSRLVRVVLAINHQQMRNEIYIKCRASKGKLKDDSLKNVYINMDKSKDELKKEYDLRCELCRRNASGKPDLVIKGGKITLKSDGNISPSGNTSRDDTSVN